MPRAATKGFKWPSTKAEPLSDNAMVFVPYIDNMPKAPMHKLTAKDKKELLAFFKDILDLGIDGNATS